MMEQKGRLILIVDDVEDNRDVYAQFLTYKGFQVALAADGEEALDKAFRFRPDLIVMDLSLPVMDGWDATRRLKKDERTKHIPVIALTAHAHDGVTDGAKEAGCDTLITKPCSPDELVKKIVKMLDQLQAKSKPRAAG